MMAKKKKSRDETQTVAAATALARSVPVTAEQVGASLDALLSAIDGVATEGEDGVGIDLNYLVEVVAEDAGVDMVIALALSLRLAGLVNAAVSDDALMAALDAANWMFGPAVCQAIADAAFLSAPDYVEGQGAERLDPTLIRHALAQEAHA